MIANISATISGERPSDGSSSSSSRGCAISARGDRHHLLLTAGERAGGHVEAPRERREELADALERILPLAPRGADEAADLQVLAHRHAREQSAAFGDDRDPGADEACGGSRARSTPSKVSEPDLSAQQARDRVDERALAGAVRPDDADELAGATESDTPSSARAARTRLRGPWPQACRRSEIRRDDGGIAHDLRGQALRDHFALVQHDDAVGERDDRAHHVLDQHDRRALAADVADQVDRARRSRPD